MKARLDEIKAKQKQAALLAEALNKSLHIQGVWPDAFHNGQTCALKTMAAMAPYPSRQFIVKRAYLVRSDGTEYELTLEQYHAIPGSGEHNLSKGFKLEVTG